MRLPVPVERFDKVFVLPSAAVVRGGPEAYVFRENSAFLDRLAVQVVAEDRRYIVLANDGSVGAGNHLA